MLKNNAQMPSCFTLQQYVAGMRPILHIPVRTSGTLETLKETESTGSTQRKMEIH